MTKVLRKSTRTSDLADGCPRVETNTVYHCLLFCFQSAIAWENQDFTRKDEKVKKKKNESEREKGYTVHCFGFPVVALFFWLLLCILFLCYSPNICVQKHLSSDFPFSHLDIMHCLQLQLLLCTDGDAWHSSPKAHLGPQGLTLKCLLNTSRNMKLGLFKIKLSSHTNPVSPPIRPTSANICQLWSLLND